MYTEENQSNFFGGLENFLHNLFKKSDNETKANLSTIEWLIYLGTLFFVLVMPFLYSRLTTENFLTPKEFFSRMFVGLLGGLFCTALFGAGVFSNKKIAFAKTKLDLALIAFFGFCALSVIWNFNGISAIRDLRGVFAIMLLFPVIVNVFRSRWQVELLLWVVVFTGLATATIGFLETYNFYFKFDSKGVIHYVKDEVLKKNIDPNAFYIPLFPQLASPDYAMGSVVSTFGNRNYLGTFAMFVAFVPLAFFFYYRNIFMKLVSLSFFGWLLYGLYMTRCRAALIGLAVGLVFMGILLLINDKGFKLIKKNIAFFIIVASLFAVGLIVSAATIRSESMWDKIKLTFTLDRLASNTYERMWVWYGNNKAFAQNIKTLLIGQGFGSFKHFFPLKEGEIFSEKNRESFTAVTFRQAHNDWIQIFSELGIVGMLLFLFLLKRFFGSIQTALRKDIFASQDGEMNGDHILVIALGGAMVAQLFAALPDFPFHRIETAVFAVLFLALVPVLTETNFFKNQIEGTALSLNWGLYLFLAIMAPLGAILNIVHEKRCWEADTLVRESEMIMTYKADDPALMKAAKQKLMRAISLDSLPGDPYCKLAAWNELVLQRIMALGAEANNLNSQNPWVQIADRNPKNALNLCDMAWKNINFNARSTYHSVIFRKMHIYYHVLNDMKMAYNEALRGLALTAGDARSIYYLYAGKIAADILRYNMVAESDIALVRQNAEKYLKKAMNYPQFRMQAQASLAIHQAQFQMWKEAYENAKEVSAANNHADPTLLNILGISSSNLGKNQEALQYMQAALRFYPGNPIYHRDIGTIYKRLGMKKEAISHFERCAASKNCPEEIRGYVLRELTALR